MSSHERKHPKDESFLATVGESVGSTLGTIAAKARAVPDALSHSSFLKAAKREGKKVVRKGRAVARKINKTASQKVRSSKFEKASRRTLRRATTAVKRVADPVPVKKKLARRERRK